MSNNEELNNGNLICGDDQPKNRDYIVYRVEISDIPYLQ